MVSFRFHLVTITAIFLAIAVGVVIGSTFVDRAIVDSLRSQIDRVSENLDERRADNDRLEADVRRKQDYVEASSAFAVSSRLTARPVLVLATRGVDDEAVRDVVLLSEQAGADVPGVVWVEPRWALQSADSLAELHDLLGVVTGSVERTRERAWAEVAEELEGPPPEPATGGAGADVGDGAPPPLTTTTAVPPESQTTIGPAPAPDPSLPGAPVLSALVDAGFLSFEARSEDRPLVASLAGRNPGVLAITGSDTDPALDGVLGPLVEALVGAELPTVVAEVYRDDDEAPSRGAVAASAVPPAVVERVTIVDHLDLEEGRVAAVLALAEMGDGVVGHYGYGPGADAVLPPWSPP